MSPLGFLFGTSLDVDRHSRRPHPCVKLSAHEAIHFPRGSDRCDTLKMHLVAEITAITSTCFSAFSSQAAKSVRIAGAISARSLLGVRPIWLSVCSLPQCTTAWTRCTV